MPLAAFLNHLTAKSSQRSSVRRKHQRRTGSAEVLEVRQLLAAQVTQMADLNVTAETGSSDPRELTQIGNTLFFTATDKTHGRELWKKEGTNPAVLVKDIFPGTDSSMIDANSAWLTAVGSTLYFVADDGINGREIWKSDGTTAGTVMVYNTFAMDSNPEYPVDPFSFNHSSGPNELVSAGGRLYYRANPYSNVNASTLMTTDGTAAGTRQARTDIYVGLPEEWRRSARVSAVGSTVYFDAGELWKSDGTNAGTTSLNAPRPQSPMTTIGSISYFTADNGTNGIELWKTDGTVAGTSMIKDINPGSGSSSPTNLTNVNGTLYFAADDGTNGIELWKSDGTTAGTVLVKNIAPAATSSNPGNFAAVGSTLYFSASDGVAGDELWKSNGTSAGTVMVGHSGTSANFTPRNLTNIGGTLYFSAFTFETGTELWKSDGTTAGTNVYRDIVAGTSPSNPSKLTNVNGVLYYTADDGVKGNELWRHDLTSNTATISDIFRGTKNSGPRSFVQAGSNVFFLADNGVNGEELWKCTLNGTGAVMVKDIYPGANASQCSDLININGTLYFFATDGVNGRELWKSDGTATGTVLVKDIFPGSGTSAPTGLTNLNGTLLFSAWGSNGQELWKSNGTTAGTVEVKDIRPGASGSIDRFTNQFVVIGSTAYFTADDGVNGAELWKTDGTAAGTTLVKDIRTSTTGSSPANLVDVNGRLYFTADDGAAGRELWQSDGTTAGTILAKDTNPGANGSVFSNFVNAGGKLYFEAYSATGSWDLWCRATPTSDTVNLQMFNASGHVRWVQSPLTAVGTSVYFAQLDNRTGTELWKSDGTAAGTIMVKDIAPTIAGPGGGFTWGSNPLNLINNNGTLFFTANNMVNGQELWMSDGTEAGTTLFHDFTGDAGSSHPENLVAINGRIFGSVMSEATGREGISVIDVVVPAVPSITAPTATIELQRPTISWTTSANAVSYDVYIKNNATGADPQVSTNVAGTSFIPNIDLGIGSHTVWVRAVSSSGTKSAWSAAKNFTITTRPSLAPMVRNQLTSRPDIIWKDVPGAVKYDLWLDNLTVGEQSTVILHNITGKSWQSATELPLGQYRAWVRGLDASGLAAYWSPAVNFSVVTPPTMTGPLTSTFSQRPQFSWNSVAGATKYDLQVRNLNTETTVYNQTGITATNWTPPADLPEGSYRWWVIAASANFRGVWTNAMDFYVGGRTELLTPAAVGSETKPTFSWKSVTGAASYELWVDRSDTYVSGIINVSGLTSTSYTPTTALPTGTFRVWVRAVSTTGAVSHWSEARTFSIVEQSAPETDPADGGLMLAFLDLRPQIEPIFAVVTPVSTPATSSNPLSDPEDQIRNDGSPGDESPGLKADHASSAGAESIRIVTELGLELIDDLMAELSQPSLGVILMNAADSTPGRQG